MFGSGLVLTELEVSFRAAEREEYFPPLPTVIAPEGGELSASAPVMTAENSKSRRAYMVGFLVRGNTQGARRAVFITHLRALEERRVDHGRACCWTTRPAQRVMRAVLRQHARILARRDIRPKRVTGTFFTAGKIGSEWRTEGRDGLARPARCACAFPPCTLFLQRTRVCLTLTTRPRGRPLRGLVRAVTRSTKRDMFGNDRAKALKEVGAAWEHGSIITLAHTGVQAMRC